jgi:two-component system, NarL family, nitrate/nitrite response regulator NarL
MPLASKHSQPLSPTRARESSSNWSGVDYEKDLIEPPGQDPDSSIRVLIVDRDSMSSDLLVNALVRNNRCHARTTEPLELLRALATRDVDLVIIGADVQTDTGTGYDLAHTVAHSHPNLSIVILLQHTTQESVIRAFRAGARGVFSRHQSITEFFDCIGHVGKGYIWAGRQETNTLVEAFKSIPTFTLISAKASPALTSRELQVVQCAAQGKTNRAIANELNLSEHTVKNYLFRAFEKLGVSSRVELLFYLNLQENIVNSPPEKELEIGQNTA